MVHGLSEHAGRYSHVGAFFAGSGYVMLLAELRGHGRTFGKRGHFNSYCSILDDISCFIEVARNRHPSLPVFLYGHSMGGNLVLNYLIRNTPPVDGAVVTSPWLKLGHDPPAYKRILAGIVNSFFPSLTQSDGINPAFLSHDEEVVRKYMDDPLVHKRISVRTFLEISSAGEYALAQANSITCPLLLMHGTDDQLTSFQASSTLCDNLHNIHSFKAWSGLFHELHNETGKEDVLEYVRNWINNIVYKL